MQIKTKPVYPVLPVGKDRRKKLTEADKAKIRALRLQNGYSDKVIAKIMGINHKTVRYWLGDKEKQNAKTILRLKNRKYDERRSEIQKGCYRYRQEVQGAEVVRKFQRENKKATQHLYTDYRITCKNPLCPYWLESPQREKDHYYRAYRYSSRVHKVCPKCNQ